MTGSSSLDLAGADFQDFTITGATIDFGDVHRVGNGFFNGNGDPISGSDYIGSGR
jgi:hypothetical protein